MQQLCRHFLSHHHYHHHHQQLPSRQAAAAKQQQLKFQQPAFHYYHTRAMAQPIELYSAGTPNGDKVHLFLQETELAHKANTINIGIGEQLTEDFLKINPNNRIPAIIDPTGGKDGQPLRVFESAAILIYLAEKTGKFLPKQDDPVRRTEVIQWLMFQMGGVGPMFGQLSHFSRRSEKIEYAIERYKNEAKRLLKVIETHLAEGREYVAAGEYTIADMAIYPWVRGAFEYKSLGETTAKDYPNIAAYLERITARPATAKAYQMCRISNLPDQTKFGTFKQPEDWVDLDISTGKPKQ